MMDEKRTIVQGFRSGAVSSGLRKKGGLDLALIVSEREATAAGVFTTNQVKAAPVVLSEKHIRSGRARAILANAGCANACTGEPGLMDASWSADSVARKLNIPVSEVLVASTGVIGARLNIQCIETALPELVTSLSPQGLPWAAQAILTTDSFPKISAFDGSAKGVPYRVVGLAKGAGMIMPHMATMLCFLVSDIDISQKDLQRALVLGTEASFNRITVDGDTSTNDTVLMLANGLARNSPLSGKDRKAFVAGLEGVMKDLARMIVRDGEGASRVVDVIVRKAASRTDARKAARTVANSSLVKTAIYGQDPNWGRIMAALGRAGIRLQEDRVDLWINDVQIVEGGLGKGQEAEARAKTVMAEKEFVLGIDLNMGTHADHVLTCDLTHDYVSINADYRT